MRKIILLLLAGVLFVLSVSGGSVYDETARIHVIANSDSKEDIAIKLEVADSIRELLADRRFESIEDIEDGLRASLDEITEVSNGTLLRLGADYMASAEVSVRYFDRKTLGNSAFPEGEYTALTVTLGEGRGHNWWSVMFPEVSLGASLAMGEEGGRGRTVILGDGTIVKIRCLIIDFCDYILTKK